MRISTTALRRLSHAKLAEIADHATALKQSTPHLHGVMAPLIEAIDAEMERRWDSTWCEDCGRATCRCGDT